MRAPHPPAPTLHYLVLQSLPRLPLRCFLLLYPAVLSYPVLPLRCNSVLCITLSYIERLSCHSDAMHYPSLRWTPITSLPRLPIRCGTCFAIPSYHFLCCHCSSLPSSPLRCATCLSSPAATIRSFALRCTTFHSCHSNTILSIRGFDYLVDTMLLHL